MSSIPGLKLKSIGPQNALGSAGLYEQATAKHNGSMMRRLVFDPTGNVCNTCADLGVSFLAPRTYLADLVQLIVL